MFGRCFQDTQIRVGGREGGREARTPECVTSLSPQAPGTGSWGAEPSPGAVLIEVRAQGGEGISTGAGRLITYGIEQIRKQITGDISGFLLLEMGIKKWKGTRISEYV